MDRFLIEYFTLGRSGSHAVMNWLCNQFDRPVLYFNNAKPTMDPALEMRNPTVKDMQNIVALDYYWKHPEVRVQLQKEWHPVMVVGFERYPLGYARVDQHRGWYPLPASSIDGWIRPNRRCRILIIRDLFNWLASRIQRKIKIDRNYDGELREWVKDHIRLWKDHAREAAGVTSYLKGPDIQIVRIIKFNEWVHSRQYRDEILYHLGVTPRNEDTNYIVDVSGGSSFDGRSYQGRASEMAIEHRHEIFNDPKFNDIMDYINQDLELLKLNDKLFGTDIYAYAEEAQFAGSSGVEPNLKNA
jgi:hypothetical protein